MLFFLPQANIAAIASPVSGMSVGVTASLTALVDTTEHCASETRLTLTKVVSGGHYMIQVSRAGGGICDYLDANVNDLIATYEFDSNGRMLNRAVWAPASLESPAIKTRVEGMLRYAFKHERQFPWLKSNVLISVHTLKDKFGVFVAPILPARKAMS